MDECELHRNRVHVKALLFWSVGLWLCGILHWLAMICTHDCRAGASPLTGRHVHERKMVGKKCTATARLELAHSIWQVLQAGEKCILIFIFQNHLKWIELLIEIINAQVGAKNLCSIGPIWLYNNTLSLCILCKLGLQDRFLQLLGVP